jgi:hypothetical protein
MGSGEAKTHLQFDFPAEKDLTFAKVKIQVMAQLADFALKQAMFGQDVTEAALDLALTQDGMRISGPLKFGDIPIELQWLEHFTDDAPFRQQIRAVGQVTTEQRRTFGYDIAPYVDGPVGTDLTLTEASGGKARLDVELDLSQADVVVDFLKWRRDGRARNHVGDPPAGERPDHRSAGSASRRATWPPQAPSSGETGGPKRLTLPDIRYGRSEMSAVEVDFDGWINVGIGGGALDAEPWMQVLPNRWTKRLRKRRRRAWFLQGQCRQAFTIASRRPASQDVV